MAADQVERRKIDDMLELENDRSARAVLRMLGDIAQTANDTHAALGAHVVASSDKSTAISKSVDMIEAKLAKHMEEEVIAIAKGQVMYRVASWVLGIIQAFTLLAISMAWSEYKELQERDVALQLFVEKDQMEHQQFRAKLSMKEEHETPLR